MLRAILAPLFSGRRKKSHLVHFSFEKIVGFAKCLQDNEGIQNWRLWFLAAVFENQQHRHDHVIGEGAVAREKGHYDKRGHFWRRNSHADPHLLDGTVQVELLLDHWFAREDDGGTRKPSPIFSWYLEENLGFRMQGTDDG